MLAAAAVVSIGLSAYQMQQNKKLAQEQADAAKREAARQASYANMEGAAAARVKGAEIAASTGGKSGGSTISGAITGVYSEIASQGRDLAASTKSRLETIDLENRYTQQAANLGLLGDIVKYSQPVVKDWMTPPATLDDPDMTEV